MNRPTPAALSSPLTGLLIALALLRTAVETPRSWVARPQNPKRRGASLPAALLWV